MITSGTTHHSWLRIRSCTNFTRDAALLGSKQPAAKIHLGPHNLCFSLHKSTLPLMLRSVRPLSIAPSQPHAIRCYLNRLPVPQTLNALTSRRSERLPLTVNSRPRHAIQILRDHVSPDRRLDTWHRGGRVQLEERRVRPQDVRPDGGDCLAEGGMNGTRQLKGRLPRSCTRKVKCALTDLDKA